MADVPLHQLEILKRMNVQCIGRPDLPPPAYKPELIIDGLIGYGLNGPPHGLTGRLIDWANAQSSEILALDAPSGIDTTTGIVFDPAIKATATMPLALPKRGFRSPGVESHIGEVYLAEISVPPAVFEHILPDVDTSRIFSVADVVRVS